MSQDHLVHTTSPRFTQYSTGVWCTGVCDTRGMTSGSQRSLATDTHHNYLPLSFLIQTKTHHSHSTCASFHGNKMADLKDMRTQVFYCLATQSRPEEGGEVLVVVWHLGEALI